MSTALGVTSPSATAAGTGAVLQTQDCQQSTLEVNDDSSSDAVTLPFTLDYFGSSYDELYVNNNGNVTFTESQSEYTPYTIGADVPPIIAPFFADVDTRGVGTVTWGTTTYQGFPTFCVNWTGVGYYSSATDLQNTFQLLLVSRPDVGSHVFDVVFNYDQVAWETGDASGGSGGFGGTSAGAGFSNGDGQANHFFQLAGSRQPGAFLDSSPSGLTHGSVGSSTLGRYVFHVRTTGDSSGDTTDLTRAFPTNHIGYNFANQGMNTFRSDAGLSKGDVLKHDDLARTFADWNSVTTGHFLWWDYSREDDFFDAISSSMNGGVCFGLALNGGRFDAHLDALQNTTARRTSSVWNKANAFGLPAPGKTGSSDTFNKEFLRMTANQFSTQFSREVQDTLRRQHDAHKDPTNGFLALRNQLVSVMRSGKNLYDPSGRTNTATGNGYAGITLQVAGWGGHEILAYSLKTEDDGSLRIGVWDNNYPNTPHTITVQTGGTWSYDTNYFNHDLSIRPGAGKPYGQLAVLPLFPANGFHFMASTVGLGAFGSGALVDVPAGVTVDATDTTGRPVTSELVIANAGVDAGQVLNLTSGNGTITATGTAHPSVGVRGTDSVSSAKSTTSSPLTVATTPAADGVEVTDGAANLAVVAHGVVASGTGVSKLVVTNSGGVSYVGDGKPATVTVGREVNGHNTTVTLTNSTLTDGATTTKSGTAVTAALNAAEAKAHPKSQRLTRTSPVKVVAGKQLKVRGTTSTAGGVVRLQELVTRNGVKVWRNVTSATVVRKSYVLTVRARGLGRHTYRVFRPGMTGYLPATTPRFTVRVVRR